MDKLKEMLSSISDNPMAKKMVMVVGGFFVFIIIIMMMASCSGSSGKRKYTYEQIQQKMLEIVVTKYNDPQHMPEEDGDSEEIELSSLITAGYFGTVASASEITNTGKSCSGNVTIENNGGKYVYYPYLECGDDYVTKSAYDVLASDDNVVTQGDGLYLDSVNGGYIYRGRNVDNYVKIEDHKFRVIKINNDDSLRLLDTTVMSFSVYDDRYNADTLFGKGVNEFFKDGLNSRLKDNLEALYDVKNGFQGKILNYMRTFDLCYEKRSSKEEVFNNSGKTECAKTIQGHIGLLQLNEFYNATISTDCKSLTDKGCFDYNYLTSISTWLITADSEDNTKAFNISLQGVDSALVSNARPIKPIITVNGNIVVTGGTGTEKDPYVLEGYISSK